MPAVAVQAGWSLLGPSWKNRAATVRWACYVAAGLAAAPTIGPWLVLVLLGCGAVELLARLRAARGSGTEAGGTTKAGGPLAGGGAGTGEASTRSAYPGESGGTGKLRSLIAAPALVLAVGGGVLASVAWEAFKIGGLSFGGGFVIIPLMQADVVGHYHWMSGAQFLNAVALGQVTPGPVVQTVAVVGYAAAGHRRGAARLGGGVHPVLPARAVRRAAFPADPR